MSRRARKFVGLALEGHWKNTTAKEGTLECGCTAIRSPDKTHSEWYIPHGWRLLEVYSVGDGKALVLLEEDVPYPPSNQGVYRAGKRPSPCGCTNGCKAVDCENL